MPATLFVCPACHAALKTPQPVSAGKLIKCPKCTQTFRATGGNGAGAAAPSGLSFASPLASPPPPPPVEAPRFPVNRLPPWRPPKRSPVLKWGVIYGLIAVAVAGAIGVAVWQLSPSDHSTGSPPPVLDPALASKGRENPAAPTRPDLTPMPPDKRAASPQAVTPPPKKKRTFPSLPGGLEAGYDDWLQDFEAAKRQAAKEKKDILLLFTGSDWCAWCMRLGNEVFLQKGFKERAREKFVLVFLDFPYEPAAQAKVQNAKRNERLRADFQVSLFPKVILTDAEGRPYAAEAYQEGGADEYWDRLLELQETHAAQTVKERK